MLTMTKEGYCAGGDAGCPGLDRRRMVRCGVCNRRLLANEYYDMDGVFVGYGVPPHKQRVFPAKTTRKKRGYRSSHRR